MSEKDININIKLPKDKRKKRFILRKRLELLNIFVIISILFVGFVYLLIFKRDTVSNEENRNLAEFPKFSVESYLSGEYTEGIARYYDDTVPNRSFFKKIISSKIMPLKGLEYGEDKLIIYQNTNGGGNNNPEPETQPNTEPATTEKIQTTEKSSSKTTTTTSQTTTTTTTTTIPQKHDPAVDGGEIANNIVVVNNRGLMLFGGSMQNGLEYASIVNQYKEILGENVNVYSMVCPTSVSYYMPENYLDLTASEEDNITNINSGLVNVTPIDVFNALLYHKNEDIYTRTDHHWSQLGAYYASEEFAKVADVPFIDISEYEKVSLPNYVGTLYGYTQSSALINNPENFVYYIPPNSYTTTYYSTSFTDPYEGSLLLDPTPMAESSYYMVFLGGDSKITHVNTDCQNGRTLVIFKDSYGNSIVPNLTGSFENIYVCDMRYFDLNSISFIQQVGATDLLFAMNTFSATGGNYTHLEELLYK